MKKVLIVAAVITAAASAQAADLGARSYSKAPMMVDPVTAWSGFYLGAQVGGAGSSGGFRQTDSGFAGEDLSFNPNSFIGGAHAGVQGQWGSWVLGLEGTYNFTDLKQTDPSTIFPGHIRSIQTSGIASVVGKIGYAWGQWLLYGKGGFAAARIDTLGSNAAGTSVVDANQWTNGYTVGAGVDYMFVKNWVVGADFNYYDFRFDRGRLVSTNGTTAMLTNGKDQVYAGSVRLSYLFNWGGTSRY
jgi:outer membrane immunogenic protein